jgi:TetR/AcrR family transcriptional repressor of nem operon
MPRQSDKRVRLVKAAKALLLKKGYNETTLADIAQEADVPLGNVYYYFKTKEAIGQAVIQQHLQDLDACFVNWNQLPDAKDRLKALTDSGLQPVEDTVNWGCAIGSLCQELCKSESPLAEASAGLMNKLLNWVQAQLQELGQNPEEARTLAVKIISYMQGMALLSNTFKDESIAKHQSNAFNELVEEVA